MREVKSLSSPLLSHWPGGHGSQGCLEKARKTKRRDVGGRAEGKRGKDERRHGTGGRVECGLRGIRPLTPERASGRGRPATFALSHGSARRGVNRRSSQSPVTSSGLARLPQERSGAAGTGSPGHGASLRERGSRDDGEQSPAQEGAAEEALPGRRSRVQLQQAFSGDPLPASLKGLMGPPVSGHYPGSSSPDVSASGPFSLVLFSREGEELAFWITDAVLGQAQGLSTGDEHVRLDTVTVLLFSQLSRAAISGDPSPASPA
ncbi:hypothetical protein COCON_G00198720 [Conger conger]|uniref:Uncharacterized protein n=1 Tax=Conger conger TaxID=82655 RepID=A0A9Q1HQL4_CONCO|nr:hypothetical protein COCON_G00198720 [Conger conger]